MKKILLTLVALICLHVTSKAQALQIVNNRTCGIMVNLFVNGGCFGTSTCSIPSGANFTIYVPPISTTSLYPDLFSASGGAVAACSTATAEYVLAGIQNHECDECSGAGLSVGEPCLAAGGFGTTCYSGTDCRGSYCADFVRPSAWLPGSALRTVW